MTSPDLLTLDEQPSSNDLDRLRRGLTDHSSPWVEGPGFRPLAVFARTPEGELVGGVAGNVNWNWLAVSLLWVAEPRRGSGLGSRLLRALESAAIERGCTRAQVDTFSYQAGGFYERHGYRVFAELDDYPPGHRRLYLRKELTPFPDRAPNGR